MTTRVANITVRLLKALKVRRFYCVPGESYLHLLDALHGETSIKTIVCRHESGAGFMAVAEAKITGNPGVFAVSRGPGATNGSIALHVAQQDAVPVVVLIGQVSRAERGRRAFQEMDYHNFLGSLCKEVFEVHQGEKMPETLIRAFSVAQSGTAGPVAIVMPEDMLGDMINDPALTPYPVPKPGISPGEIERSLHVLKSSQRPLILAGAALRSPEGKTALKNFAEMHQVPVAVTWKNQDLFDNSSPLYAGHLGFGNPAVHKEMLAKCDLIIAIGTRLGDVASQNYSFPKAPEPDQPLIHIYPDAEPINAVIRADLAIVADPAATLTHMCRGPAHQQEAREKWCGELTSFIDEFMTFSSPEPEDGVDFGVVTQELAAQADKNAIIITDAGNFSTWVHRHWRMSSDNLMLGAIAGAMGFGMPAAVAASLIEPERMTIAVIGDGGMLMTGQELATAMQYGGKPKIIVSNNGSYGTIRSHQERRFPDRVSGTDLHNPDFSQWAAAFGVEVVTIAKGDDVTAKLGQALASDNAVVVEVKSSRTALSAFATLDN